MGKGLLRSVGIGAMAGIAGAAGMALGRASTRVSLGKGHPLKHRLLDLAAGAMQRRYPVEAVSIQANENGETRATSATVPLCPRGAARSNGLGHPVERSV